MRPAVSRTLRFPSLNPLFLRQWLLLRPLLLRPRRLPDVLMGAVVVNLFNRLNRNNPNSPKIPSVLYPNPFNRLDFQ
jgi:hypothetical protein